MFSRCARRPTLRRGFACRPPSQGPLLFRTKGAFATFRLGVIDERHLTPDKSVYIFTSDGGREVGDCYLAHNWWRILPEDRSFQFAALFECQSDEIAKLFSYASEEQVWICALVLHAMIPYGFPSNNDPVSRLRLWCMTMLSGKPPTRSTQEPVLA